MYVLIISLVTIFGGAIIIFLYYGIIEILDGIKMRKYIKEMDNFYNKQMNGENE